jgi:hypothetical protein
MISHRYRFAIVMIAAASAFASFARETVGMLGSLLRGLGEFVLTAMQPARLLIAEFESTLRVAAPGIPLDPSLLNSLSHESRTSRIGSPRNI